MKYRIKFTLLLLSIIFVAKSCIQNKGEKVVVNEVEEGTLNPNGDSELALLMRAIYSETEQVKKQIEEGTPIKLSVDYANILKAEATEPEKAASSEFKAFAKAYIHSVDSLRDAKPTEAIKSYTKMLNNCMTCHKALCPGPLSRIKKLKHS